MKKFMDEDFLLLSEPAKKLYHDYAENMPILDYHCHISPKEIAEDRHFDNITQVWLGGDHYKWRLMRAFGLDEKYMTGDASDKEKFLMFAKCLGRAVGNPLYHWGVEFYSNLYTAPVYETGDIIDTYVYRVGLTSMQYSFATAIGLMKSVIAFVLMMLANHLAKKYTDSKIF